MKSDNWRLLSNAVELESDVMRRYDRFHPHLATTILLCPLHEFTRGPVLHVTTFLFLKCLK